ncbi:Mediator complex, subunit Med11 [Metarhizium rileyi]|uniref:Mediator of RNA polymerase II transcription subunit 11 n=1 Tax=Metarhizium rileyi (strain RCEF 4871) TaxID=1649241 RepID=A0A167FLH6_METRR|nr:Mediator complex, subunit Med11 [Metarhizium rileyi RCEF 4871]
MASPNDIIMGQDEPPQQSQASEPFTVEENIHQLNAIDKSIAQLMSQTATALNALTTQTPSTSPSNDDSLILNPPAQKEAFKSATDAFLTTLHSIDVRMKRQIMALEEAGIVHLSNTQRQGPNGAAKSSLRPNGVGTVGNLDVGWLNSRGTRVERDMEAELWQDAKEFLQKEQSGTRP